MLGDLTEKAVASVVTSRLRRCDGITIHIRFLFYHQLDTVKPTVMTVCEL